MKLSNDPCCICGESIATKAFDIRWEKGNNAWPVERGQCCDMCNLQIVQPARMREARVAPTHGGSSDAA